MNQHLTQPEEVDLALKEMEIDDMTDKREFTDDMLLSNVIANSWNTGNLSPYRAAYMRDHNLNMQR